MNKNIKTIFKIGISFILIYFLITNLDFIKLGEIWSKANWLLLIALFPLKITTLILNGANINLFIKTLNKRIHFWKVFLISNLALSLGLFFPGKIGEFSLVYFLKRDGLLGGEGTAIAIMDKLITFVFLSILALFGIVWYFDFISAIKIGLVIAAFLFITMSLLTRQKIREFIKRYFLRKYASFFTGFNYSFRQILNDKKSILLNFLVTGIKWTLSFVSLQIGFLSFGIKVGLPEVSLITAIAILVSLIPISIAGLGIRESVAVYLFVGQGVAPEIAASVYLINTFINYLFGATILLLKITKIEKN